MIKPSPSVSPAMSFFIPSKSENIAAELSYPTNSAIVVTKRGYIEENGNFKGMGSAFGGKWKPKKPEDERFLGEPGEIKSGIKNGYRVDTKIGENGKATIERHYTDHNQSYAHTNPHDHIILWNNENGHPEPQGPINYPDGAPEFKTFKGVEKMSLTYYHSSAEENRFETIGDFKRCMHYNGEVEFEWKGITYDIAHPDGKILIAEANKEETALWADTVDEVLRYNVGGDRLRDIITEIDVIYRTI